MEQKYEDMFTSQMKIIYHDFQEKSRTTSTQSVNLIQPTTGTCMAKNKYFFLK